ncbi:MAG: hypothetical protein GW823_07125 [Bacteroidetes bacterium]|nr:hypothetical protein [Bacteroidota bacterium]
MTRIERLQNFLEHNPNDEFSSYALALEYKKIKKINEAVDMLKQCINLNSANLAAYFQLCEIYSTQNEIELLNIYLEKAKIIAKDQNDLKTFNELISLEHEAI